MRRVALFSALAIVCAVGCEGGPESMPVGGAPSHVDSGDLQLARDFTVKSVADGSQVKLSSLKGKVVVVDFWATWCGPCRAIMPTIDELYTKYRDKGFDVMAISDESPETVKSFAKAEGYTYPFFIDFMGAANGAYKVSSIPHTVVVDREGRIVYEEVGADPVGLATAVSKAMAES